MSEQSKRLITLSWRDMRDLALFLPAIHIIVCSIFLFFYCYGFGRSVESFFEPTDIFQISLKDIGFTYLAFLFIIPIGIYLGSALKKSGVRKEKEDGTLDVGCIYNLWVWNLCWLNLLLLMIVVIYGRLYFMLTGSWSVSSVIGGLGVFGLAVLIWRFFWRPKRTDAPLFALLLFPFYLTAYFGAGAGERDSLATFADAKMNSASCGENAVLRNVGDYLLAVTKDGRSVLIDNDCKRRFEFAAVIRKRAN